VNYGLRSSLISPVLLQPRIRDLISLLKERFPHIVLKVSLEFKPLEVGTKTGLEIPNIETGNKQL
jgi:hypothetical protein